MSLVTDRTSFQRVFQQVNSGSANLTPSAAGAGVTNVASTVTVTGAALGDIVDVSPPSSLLNLILQGEVTAAGVVTLKFANVSAGSITPPPGVYKVATYSFTPEVV